jgi:hypothetical membrane protein
VRTLDWRLGAGFAALAAPVLMWSEFLAVGLNRQGYNLLTRPFSDLATIGTPESTLFDVGFFLVPGVLTVIVGLGLWKAATTATAWKVGAGLVVGAGVFLLATGIFRQDPSSPAAGPLHGTVSQVCFALASVAPLVLLAGSRGMRHAPPRLIWIVTAIAALLIEGFGVLVRPALHYPYGVFQRPFTLALTVWFVTTGAWLLSVRKIEGLSVRD